MEIFNNIFKSVLVSLYQYFWSSLLFTVLTLMALNYLKRTTLKHVIKEMLQRIKKDKKYRYDALFVFFCHCS